MRKGWVDGEGTVASVIRSEGRGGPMFEVVFTFKVDTHFYGGTFTTNEEYAKDDTVTFTYDPADPDRNSLAQSESIKHWVIGGVVVVIAVVVLLVALN